MSIRYCIIAASANSLFYLCKCMWILISHEIVCVLRRQSTEHAEVWMWTWLEEGSQGLSDSGTWWDLMWSQRGDSIHLTCALRLLLSPQSKAKCIPGSVLWLRLHGPHWFGSVKSKGQVKRGYWWMGPCDVRVEDRADTQDSSCGKARIPLLNHMVVFTSSTNGANSSFSKVQATSPAWTDGLGCNDCPCYSCTLGPTLKDAWLYRQQR